MKITVKLFSAALLLASAGSALAGVHYVDANHLNSSPPYTNWLTAATNLQDAVDAAIAGDEIVVTNGIYTAGGRAVDGTTNRVAVDKPLTLRSVNGPQVTTIDGDRSVRCVYLNNGGGVAGLTLTNGSARFGGGVWCELRNEPTNAVISHCMLAGNFADVAGGGAYACTLNNRTLAGNSTVVTGGGASGGRLNNCIVYFNTAPSGANFDSCSTLNYSCTTPQPTNGVGNITNAPLFVDQASGNLRLQSDSPCINAGLNAFAPAGPDLDGNPRIVGDTVDIGAYEFQGLGSLISYAWLQQYALPTDGSADTADPDGDRLNNWQEWRCGTDPTNALSALRLLTPTPFGSNLVVRWESVADRTYILDRSATASSPSRRWQQTFQGKPARPPSPTPMPLTRGRIFIAWACRKSSSKADSPKWKALGSEQLLSRNQNLIV